MAYSKLRRALGVLVKEFAEQQLPKPVVDLGGTKISRRWLGPLLSKQGFETWNMQPGTGVSKVVDLCYMPQVPSSSIGTAISTSVLEHVYNPFSFANETSRVVKSGGLLLVTTVFSFRYHKAPEDYWRFTPAALRLLFGDYFEEIRCDFIQPGGVFFWGRRKQD